MELFDNIREYRVILGSGSPRRKELLAMLDIDFEVRSAGDVDESYPADLPAEEVPLYLARKKSNAFLSGLRENELVITADTVVICDNNVLGKPADTEEAFRMLKMLSGRKHAVVTGITVATREIQISDTAITEVEFAPLSDDTIREYIGRYRPMDKAGAYGIQEWIGAVAVKGINGSFYNVMGLPLHLLTTLLLRIPVREHQ
ncbi:MAG: septum formation protein Maf [Muribaculaceae bacterium]|nr:septum formation protein Maf [Muribaculaceae bacterium]